MSRLHSGPMRILIGEIASDRCDEGDLLPKASDIADRFDLSHGVVRECLRGLEERRLVEVRHGHGAIVKAETEWDRFDPDVLAALIGGPRAAGVLREYLECRRILEVQAAGLAAERATAAALEAVSLAYERMRLTAEGARRNAAGEQLYHDADVAFHRAVVLAAGNPVLGRMTEPIHRALAATFGALARPRMRFERGLPEHERILAAIRAQDPEQAREAMRAHLLTVEGYLHEYSGASAAASG